MKTTYNFWLLVAGGLLVTLFINFLWSPSTTKKTLRKSEYNAFTIVRTASTTKPRDSPQFAYLIQGASVHPVKNLIATPNREIIWLTYRDQSGDIYFPNSTLAEGRNRLLKEAVDRASEKKDGGYLYYVFLDDDVLVETVQNTSFEAVLPENSYDRFELFLLDFLPAVGYPRPTNMKTKPTDTVGIAYNFDAMINAYHRHTISFMLPLVEDLDHLSWWFPQWFVIHVSAMFYNSYRMYTHTVYRINPRPHWKNKVKGAYPASGDFTLPRDYMRTWFIKDTIVDTMNIGNVSLLQTFKKPAMYSFINGMARRKGNMEYRVSTEFITTVFGTSHPAIKRILRWRNQPKVRKILYGEDKDEPKFISDVLPLH